MHPHQEKTRFFLNYKERKIHISIEELKGNVLRNHQKAYVIGFLVNQLQTKQETYILQWKFNCNKVNQDSISNKKNSRRNNSKIKNYNKLINRISSPLIQITLNYIADVPWMHHK